MFGKLGTTYEIDTTTGESRRLTDAEVEAHEAAAKREHAERVKAKGHDCWAPENVEHGFDEDSRLGDYYTCGICGDLLQVG